MVDGWGMGWETKAMVLRATLVWTGWKSLAGVLGMGGGKGHPELKEFAVELLG